jgi:hypothetical protein
MSSALYTNKINVLTSSTGIPTVVLGGTNNSQSIAGNTQLNNTVLAVNTSTGPSMILTAGSPVVTIPSKGLYAIKLRLCISNVNGGNVGVYVIGSDGVYYALNYTYTPANVGSWCECFGLEVLPAGLTLTPWAYSAGNGSPTGSVTAQNSTLSRFTVSQIWTSQ